MPSTQSITAFLEGLAEAFRIGDMAKAAAPFEAPATISVAGKKLFVQDRSQAEAMLAVYHDNLMVEDYAKTALQIHHVAETPDQQVRVLLTWSQISASGRTISTLDLSYFLKPAPQDGWTITLIEMVNTPTPRLATGLPIH